MIKPITVATVALAGLTLSAVALASDEVCPDYPKDQWMSKDELTQKATEMGYDVRKVKAEDGCWEIKGFDKEGNRVEAYLDPTTAEIKKVKD